MSKTKKKVKKVELTETQLVDLIDNIVTEAVAEKKKQWISEQKQKNKSTSVLEERIQKLESKLTKLTESK
jgi:DNA repair exonuclease SbcCD ATPase subunit